MSELTDHSLPSLSILHFNDVYDIQPDNIEPKGGSAHFAALMDRYRETSTLTFFSGDAFSPSLLSAENKGENMIKPLNAMKIDLACLGNHDFDYPLPHVQHLKNSTNFPWLLSNVIDKKSGNRLEGTLEYKILEKGGFKIGIFSLAEEEWMDTLIPDYKEILEYISWEEFTSYMIKQLKSENCNLIIALTHMMRYNDVKLAQKFPEIDLILGGHDHLVVHEQVNNSILIKSGTNFKNFSFVEVFPIDLKDKLPKKEVKSYEKEFFLHNDKICTRLVLVEVNHSLANIEPLPELHEYVEHLYKDFKQRQERIAAHFQEDIDLRFKSIRRKQNSYLEFLVSLFRHYTKSDCALMNSGNFRADTYIPAGPVSYGLLTNIIQDEIVVIKASGSKLLKGLENCISMYPNLSGRYSTFSGIEFTWDCSKEPYSRILVDTVKINGSKLIKEKIYRVTVHGFVAKGGDGFDVFKDCDIDHDHFHDNNLLLVHELLTGSLKLLTGYEKKYPGRISWIVDDYGHKVLKLHVPNPKNVKLIGEEEKKPEEKKPEEKQIKESVTDETQTDLILNELILTYATSSDGTQTDQIENDSTQADSDNSK